MKFTTITTLTAFVFASMAPSISATPVHLESRDVFVPPITYPTAATVWNVGEKYNVTW